MSLHAHDEVLKLTRELQADPGSLDGLAVCDAGELRRLRGMVGDALHDAHRPAFQRAAVGQRPAADGPDRAARPDPHRALPGRADRRGDAPGPVGEAGRPTSTSTFLADVCLSLDPARVADTVRGLPDDQVIDGRACCCSSARST